MLRRALTWLRGYVASRAHNIQENAMELALQFADPRDAQALKDSIAYWQQLQERIVPGNPVLREDIAEAADVAEDIAVLLTAAYRMTWTAH